MRSKLIFALTLSARLAAPLVLDGTAVAQSPRPAPHAADQSLGMAILSAHVDLSGNPVVGAGVVGATRVGDGQQFVAFNRSVEGCVYTGAVSATGRYHGLIMMMGDRGTFNGATYYGVRVRTAKPDGGVDDRPFDLLVFCAQ